MKNLLIATTALVATAGMASAEVTFAGKGEAGMYRTGKTADTALTYGVSTADGVEGLLEFSSIAYNAAGQLETTAADEDDANFVALATVADAATTALANIALIAAKDGMLVANGLVLAAADAADVAAAASNLADAKAALALAQAVYDANVTGATTGDVTGDMIAYSGYDFDITASAETDGGIVFGMAFDMGAGLIADQNDDRAMDSQGATIATSALSATMNGYTLKIGQDKVDDTYDDAQNGDIGISGNVGGVAFNLVHDLTDEVVGVAATYVEAAQTIRTAATTATNATGNAVTFNADDTDPNQDLNNTPVAGDSDFVGSTYTDAVAATIETTSLSLGGAVGDIAWSLAATNGDDRGDSAAKGSITYTGVENLSLTLAHDNVGNLEGITKVTAAYTMGALKATLSMSDDKDKNSNTNTGGKASTNLSLAYAANGLAATFATDESSQWWVNSTYDLGAGAQVFATIDHTEFAVVGVNFKF